MHSFLGEFRSVRGGILRRLDDACDMVFTRFSLVDY